jgi:hypothetical protein
VSISLVFQEIEYWLKDDYVMSAPVIGQNPANFQSPNPVTTVINSSNPVSTLLNGNTSPSPSSGW